MEVIATTRPSDARGWREHVTFLPWVDRPTLRLDDAGRRSAARQIARPIDERLLLRFAMRDWNDK